MNDSIQHLLSEIVRLEDELATVFNEQQERLHYRIEGSKIRFEENLRRIHHERKTGVFAWLRESEWRSIVTAPFIYSMIIPFVALDIFRSVYQAIFLPLYRMPKVRRADYIIIDRHHPGYLNIIEKLNRAYCGYTDGLLAYARQILSRTKGTGARSSMRARFLIHTDDMRAFLITLPEKTMRHKL